MLLSHTIRLDCSAAYSDGTILFEEEILIADTAMKSLPTAALNQQYQMIQISILVPKAKAEDLLGGLRSGRSYLFVEQMKTALEQAA